MANKALLLSVLLLLCGVSHVSSVSSVSSNSLLTVADGVYSGLTVRVSEDVPKHFCSRLLNKLEVNDEHVRIEKTLLVEKMAHLVQFSSINLVHNCHYCIKSLQTGQK